MVRLKKVKKQKTRHIGIRTTDKEYNEIKKRALLYTEGNVSEFMLYAAKNYEIKEKDLE